jgi:hypothetical protein
MRKIFLPENPKMKKKNYAMRLLVICTSLLIILLVGCSGMLNNQSLTISPFQTRTESATFTRPESTNTITLSPSPIPTIRVTDTPIPTFFPTPPGNTVQEKLKYLDETNGGCNLPCFWGIEPGKTEWTSAEPFLRSFTTSLTHGWGSPRYQGVIYRADYDSLIQPGQTLDSLFYVASVGPKIDIIEIIDTLSNHTLADFLNSLGTPDQVWINLEPLNNSFSLVIVYNAGEMLFYRGFYADGQDDNFVICSADVRNKNSDLWLWDPASGRSWQDIGKLSTIIPPLTSSDIYRSIEELTGLQPKDFYTMFNDSSSSRCMKISAAKLYKNP